MNGDFKPELVRPLICGVLIVVTPMVVRFVGDVVDMTLENWRRKIEQRLLPPTGELT